MGMGRPVPRPRKLRPRNPIQTRMASRPRIIAGRHPRSTRRSSHRSQQHVLITKSPPNDPKTRANPPRRSRKRAPPSPSVAEISTRLRRPASSFPAARRPRPVTSSRRSGRSRPSKTKDAPRPPRRNNSLVGSPGLVPSPSRSSPTRSPASTRTPDGRPSARN